MYNLTISFDNIDDIAEVLKKLKGKAEDVKERVEEAKERIDEVRDRIGDDDLSEPQENVKPKNKYPDLLALLKSYKEVTSKERAVQVLRDYGYSAAKHVPENKIDEVCDELQRLINSAKFEEDDKDDWA